MQRKGPKVKDYHNYQNEYLKVKEYLGKSEWLCECKCSKTFKTRTHLIEKRKGCRSCTSSINMSNKEIPHYGYLKRLYKEYKISAEKRNLEFNINFELFITIISQNCSYCGSEPQEINSPYLVKTMSPLKRNGIDRIDSNIGYIPTNVTSCCSKCNYAKHEMSFDEFKSWINKIYHNIQEKGSETIPTGSTLQANGSGNGEYLNK